MRIKDVVILSGFVLWTGFLIADIRSNRKVVEALTKEGERLQEQTERLESQARADLEATDKNIEEARNLQQEIEVMLSNLEGL